jgi:hypothetical protein
MIRSRRTEPLIILCLTLLVFLPTAAPAQAKVLPVQMSGSGLVVNGIPLPDGAVPSMAANLSLDDIHAMVPGSVPMGPGRLRAVVYELQIAAPPDAVIDFYRRELQRPVALTAPDRSAEGRADDGLRVLQFLGATGYLAIRAEEQSRPSVVTVAVVEGHAAAPAVLAALTDLRAGAGPKPAKSPPLLSPPWQSTSHFEGVQLELLQRFLQQGNLPGPEVNVMRALFRQARALNRMSRIEPRVISRLEILSAFRDEARLQTWALVSVEETSPQEVQALYRLQNDNGMVMLRAGPPPPSPAVAPRLAATSTQITRFEVTGPIHFEELFHPILLRPRPVLAPPVRAPLPRGPFQAQPHR